ncbi:hypothetical protein NMS_0954 [Nonlabens marinus S1-08]|uniref:Uncharacterized protein n=1 Tax=Nonlabens marinus S1-08 TaxID=1454201 RepID=W8VUX2_9FLAO|nr:hypothetical protein NMS_0954 [Nonlabens marinus S1-08]
MIGVSRDSFLQLAKQTNKAQKRIIFMSVVVFTLSRKLTIYSFYSFFRLILSTGINDHC